MRADIHTTLKGASNAERIPAMSSRNDFEPPLDEGIEREVCALLDAGIETFESCEGGAGHCYPEPTIRFHGGAGAGFKALGIAIERGLRVKELRRTWPISEDMSPTGPWWEMTFLPPTKTT